MECAFIHEKYSDKIHNASEALYIRFHTYLLQQFHILSKRKLKLITTIHMEHAIYYIPHLQNYMLRLFVNCMA